MIKDITNISNKAVKKYVCGWCEDTYFSIKKNSQFCSGACKQGAYNARKSVLTLPSEPVKIIETESEELSEDEKNYIKNLKL